MLVTLGSLFCQIALVHTSHWHQSLKVLWWHLSALSATGRRKSASSAVWHSQLDKAAWPGAFGARSARSAPDTGKAPNSFGEIPDARHGTHTVATAGLAITIDSCSANTDEGKSGSREPATGGGNIPDGGHQNRNLPFDLHKPNCFPADCNFSPLNLVC